MPKNITKAEAEEVIREAEQAQADAWQEYRLAEIALLPFSTGALPCPKCGNEMECGSYHQGREPYESSRDPYASFTISYLLFGDDGATAEKTPKKNSKWYWQVERLHWHCETCGYSFDTKTKDAR